VLNRTFFEVTIQAKPRLWLQLTVPGQPKTMKSMKVICVILVSFLLPVSKAAPHTLPQKYVCFVRSLELCVCPLRLLTTSGNGHKPEWMCVI